MAVGKGKSKGKTSYRHTAAGRLQEKARRRAQRRITAQRVKLLEELGLEMSGSAMGICDTMRQLGYEGDLSDRFWPLDEIKPRLDAALAEPGNLSCDYIGPKLEKLSAIICKGEARGARFLTVS